MNFLKRFFTKEAALEDDNTDKTEVAKDEMSDENADSEKICATDDKNDCGNEKKAKHKRLFGIGWRCFYAFGGISVILFVIMVISPEFSDLFNRYISSHVRAALALITVILPFSLAEVILILTVPAIVALMVLAVKKYCDSWKTVWAFIGKMFSIAVFLAATYIWGFAPGYYGSTLDAKLEIQKEPVSAQDLRQTADILTELVNEEAKNIQYGEDGFSSMPYSMSKMNSKLLDAYDKLSEEYDFIPVMYSRVKPVMMSELMSYTHITGVYSFFTGEANLNVAFSDYTLPFTAAHELAHQRGVAREDEANFIAFLVCSMSDDSYIRYSGYLNLLEYVSNAYYSADVSAGKADYIELRYALDLNVRLEQKAHSEWFDKYRDSVASDISETVNNIYLQGMGTPGTVSYGMVVDLAVAYYKNKPNK